MQSLSVIFLFQAFVEHLLADLYEADSSPLLALEEPETHLHPQAARTLWVHVNNLPGQKLITTHSPYFVQHVPFRDLRLVRLTENGTEVRWLPPSFSAQVPHVAGLDPVVAGSGGVIAYDRAAQTLTVRGRLEEAPYRDLLTSYGTHPERAVIHGVLRDLRDRSQLFISDEELRQLETFARRIRGEIFFARRWMIVEGQGEYLIVHSLARSLGYDLDEHGVALIDAVNNGNPTLFAALARALGIPWTAVFDGDAAGQRYVNALAARGFDPAFIAQRCRTHAAGHLEDQLLADGLEPELRSILQALGQNDAAMIDRPTLQRRLADNKIPYAAALAARLNGDGALAQRMPQAFRDAIASLRGLT
jgi:putative ATP-dependent endonuclease of OLD family